MPERDCRACAGVFLSAHGKGGYMRGMLAAGAAACVLLTGLGGRAAAQPAGRVFEQGPVVVINEVRILPGQRRAYAQELATRWRASMEEAKARGEVLDYRVYANTHARRGEGDFFFITTYRDAAVQDVGFAERERRVTGVPPPAVSHEQLFEILSTTMLREQVFVQPPAAARR